MRADRRFCSHIQVFTEIWTVFLELFSTENKVNLPRLLWFRCGTLPLFQYAHSETGFKPWLTYGCLFWAQPNAVICEQRVFSFAITYLVVADSFKALKQVLSFRCLWCMIVDIRHFIKLFPMSNDSRRAVPSGACEFFRYFWMDANMLSALVVLDVRFWSANLQWSIYCPIMKQTLNGRIQSIPSY